MDNFYFFNRGAPAALRVTPNGDFIYHEELIGNDPALAKLVVTCCQKFIDSGGRDVAALTVDLMPELLKIIFDLKEEVKRGQKPQPDEPSKP